MKEAVVALSPAFNSDIRKLGINMLAVVHDDLVFHGPIEVCEDPKTQELIREVMETTSVDIRVPMKVSMKITKESWAA